QAIVREEQQTSPRRALLSTAHGKQGLVRHRCFKGSRPLPHARAPRSRLSRRRHVAQGRRARAGGERSARALPPARDGARRRGIRQRGVSATLAHFGALDVVVNNAGYGQFGTIEEASDAEARRNYDVNVFGLPSSPGRCSVTSTIYGIASSETRV